MNQARVNTALIFLSLFVVIFVMSFYTVGLEVFIDGNSVGYVFHQDEVDAVVANVSARVGEILEKPYLLKPNVSYRFSLVRRHDIFDSEQVGLQLFSQVSELKDMFVLSVNGQIIGGSTDSIVIQNLLCELLEIYSSDDSVFNVRFAADISISRRLADSSYERTPEQWRQLLFSSVMNDNFSSDSFLSAPQRNMTASEVVSALNPNADQDSQAVLVNRAVPYLSVSYTRRISYTEDIGFETEIRYDDTKFNDYSALEVEGSNGEALIYANTFYIDNIETGSELVSRIVTKNPVNEVIVKGTKKRQASGTFISPYDGVLSSKYGSRYLYGKTSVHTGIDIAGPLGDIVVASDGGKVIFSGMKNGYGSVVIIDHQNGYTSLYGHCSKLLVKEGQMVGQGEAIAKIGNTGRSTGPHVHFEIRIDDKHVNPLKYLTN